MSDTGASNRVKFTQRPATPEDRQDILALIPRLGEIDLPAHRRSDHAWHGVRDIFMGWLDGDKPDTRVTVATSQNRVVGVVMTSLREEALSYVLSAHVDAIAVAKDMEGNGIAADLLEAAQEQAKADGAECMTLNVFTRNTRAQRLYEKFSFDGEMIRYYKSL